MGRQSRRKKDIRNTPPSARNLPPELRPKKPEYEKESNLPLREIRPPEKLLDSFIKIHEEISDPTPFYLKTYQLGDCNIIVTKELGLLHLSINHKSRYPTWHEICQARYRLLPADRTIAMILPPKEAYINYNSNVFQMVELESREIWSMDTMKKEDMESCDELVIDVVGKEMKTNAK